MTASFPTNLGADRVVVVGHSIMGALAIEYARRYLGTGSLLVLVGMSPHGDMRALTTAANAFFETDASMERREALAVNLRRLPRHATAEEQFLAQAPFRFFDPRVDMRRMYAGAISRPAILAHLLGAADCLIGRESRRAGLRNASTRRSRPLRLRRAVHDVEQRDRLTAERDLAPLRS